MTQANDGTIRNTYYARNPSASERLARVHYGHLCAIRREQELANAAREPKLRLTCDTIDAEISRLKEGL